MNAAQVDGPGPDRTWALTPPGSFELCANPSFQDDATAQLRSLVELTRHATQSAPASGLLLTGSLARGEGAITLAAPGRIRWLSDVECLVVFSDRYRPDFPRIRQLLARTVRQANDAPERRRIALKIELTPILASRLRSMRPAIFTRELLDHGKLLCGQPRDVPSPIDFPYSCDSLRCDAFRLLNNRIIEVLALRSGCIQTTETPTSISYSLNKFLVEVATSLSVFLGCYTSTYRGRQIALESALKTPQLNIDPDSTGLLARRLKRATQIKLGEPEPGPGCEADYDTVTRVAQDVWWWETDRLLGAATARADDWEALTARLRRIEGGAARARDWARLVLRTGLRANLRPGSFAAVFRAGSFGNAIYSSGCLLSFFWAEIGSATPWVARSRKPCAACSMCLALPDLPLATYWPRVPTKPGTRT